MDISDEQIGALVAWAGDNPLIEAVYLFGSRVKGTAREDSDLDVALDLGWSEDAGLTLFIKKEEWEIELRKSLGLLVNLDLYHMTVAPVVYGYVQEHGRMVYRR
ncbi:nucleotidyltransferase domain-containing protein [Agrobacterium vitis]|uniref:nucleotidyltransferase domain-containing protein n=1 Tax=Agrobacterium vitis TaxID=373 RepID=UPI0015749291|nr:nucleotidyltransferase domain-containing protein [Agrobacterium vitis]NSZ52962.1 nucleotidyltransferase domain-containing protein [Agrobacterium vitis]NTA31721.1 nucleotidyltransferase domain-containing protein [Agrobacterium vitis]